MRIRYGKPIKVKSLLGKSNIPFSITAKNGGWGVASKNNYSFKEGWSSGLYSATDTIKTDITANHVYFAFYSVTSTLEYKYARNCPKLYYSDGTTVFGNENKYYSALGFCCSILEPTTSGSVLLYIQNYNDFWTIGDTVNYAFMIDITDIYESSMTAQKFYNKYNKYFPLIATGEEITIDDKAGQIKTIKSSLDDYIELEYIESQLGYTSHINTGITLNQDSSIEVEYQFPESVDGYRARVWGATDDTAYVGSKMYAYASTNSLVDNALFGYGNQNIKSSTPIYPAGTTKHHIKQIKNKLYLDGELIKTYSTQTFESYGNAYLFQNNNPSGNASNNASMRIFMCKIWSDDALVRNFIPVIRKSDNEIGMLDKVNNVFYTNQGTGTFIAGPVKSLPSEYQQVEYIEGDGGQYMSVINNLNDKSIDGNLTVGYKFQATVHDRAMYFSTIEASLSAGQAYSLGYIGATGPLYIRWNQIANSATEVADYQVGDIVEVTRTNNVQTTLKTYSLFTHGDARSLAWKGRIYKYWLKLNDEYLFNWIPCYRKSDNVIGLYDLISRTFVTNVGTGSFTKGNDINNAISCEVAGGSSDIYYGYNQLIEVISRANINGLTFTPEGNNVYSISGTAQKSYASWHLGSLLTDDDTYLVGIQIIENPNNLSLGTGLFNVSGGSTSAITSGSISKIVTYPAGANKYFGINGFASNTVLDGTKIRLWLIDLSEWYYNRTIPTLSEHQEKFTKEYYGYCPTPIKLTRYQIEALPSYGYNQYCQYGDFSSSSGWSKNGTNTQLSFSNGECLCTPGGDTYPGISRTFNGYKANHKMLYILDVWSDSNNVGKSLCINNGTGLNTGIGTLKLGWNTYGVITTLNADKNSGTIFFLYNPALETFKFRNIIAIDLTEWYGPGNEPATRTEFKATFPNKYYPYSKKRLLNKYMINKLRN